MKNEFISYEQSLALKELGFDEPCFMFYEQGTNSKYLQQGIDDDYCGDYSEQRDWNSIPNKPWKPFCQCISAPLYRQAFRWFRGKYNLDYSIKPVYGKKHFNKYRVSVYSKTKLIQVMKYYFPDNPYFDSREEAELECLKELIKIVKNE